eukprot:m.186923 g.186923  ORF g.186923 m.186923 type:complete len:235 (-) comp10011_c0_seq10:161-865(-)
MSSTVMLALLALARAGQSPCVRLPVGSAMVDCPNSSVSLFATAECAPSTLLAKVAFPAHVSFPPSRVSWAGLLAACAIPPSPFTLDRVPASAKRPTHGRGPASRLPRGLLSGDNFANHPESEVLVAHRRSATPPVPAGCFATFNGTSTAADDDDSTSEGLGWPFSLHCSDAGQQVVPPLVPQLEFIHLSHNLITSLASDSFAETTALLFLSLSENVITSLPSGVFNSLTILRRL